MCGISGILNWQITEPVIKEELDKLQSGIDHRGPDGEGVYLKGNIGLGHKRLSIIDLMDGSQPMMSWDEKIVLVFNGEVYNYIEIRDELILKGHIFRTKSDTEVIIEAYIEWGQDCVNHFNGMWAFAILDQRGEPFIFCSRDRMGIKPFYYRMDSQRIVFSSEIKAFYGIYDFSLVLNKKSAMDYLMYGPISGGQTIVNEIKELESGSNLLIKNGRININRYFRLEETFDKQRNSFEIQTLKDLLIDSIELRLRSDVPLATINSGGLDSSLISSVASSRLDNLYTYCVSPVRPQEYKGHLPGDERAFAELLSSHIKSIHKTIEYDPDVFYSYLDKTIFTNDGELFHSNSIPMNYMFNEISKDGIKVVLGGEGADEIFGGYYSNRLMKLSRLLGKYVSQKIIFKKYPHKIYLLDQYKDIRRLIPLLRSSHFSHDDARELLDIDPNMDSERKEIFYLMEQMSPENALAYYEQKCYLAGLLRRADRMSMVNKIELRVPFMDHRLVLALNNISAELKSGVTRSSEKRILKQIAKGKVPNAIINRKKYGFGSPLKLYEGFFANRLSIENRFKNNYISLEQLWLLNTIFFNTGEIKK